MSGEEIEVASRTFWDLVKLALPEDVHPRELLALAPQKWWDEKPYLACAYALRKSPRINWDAYVARNEDVRQSGMDPCLHWLKHGIFEGRKLISWHKLKEPEKLSAPLVSVVIINYNNAHLLEKCISSVTSQTLKNIEIIIVDDCSTDESLEVIQSFAANDPRIRVIVNERNSATLITRKRGVEAATGRYLMFLDSDDFYAPDAFETAAREIAKGYDMVKFGVHVVNSLNAPEDEISSCAEWSNRGENREYFYDDIVATIFRDRKLNWTLWNVIYLRELSLAAFNALGEKYFTGPDDVLAVLATAHRARTLLKIPRKLIYYNFGPGVSVTSDKNKVLKYLAARCETVAYLRGYAEKYGLNVGLDKLYSDLCWELINKTVDIAGDREAAWHFANLMNILGPGHVFKVLIGCFSHRSNEIVTLCRPLPQDTPRISHIGVFCPASLVEEFIEALEAFASLVKMSGYGITIFTEGALSYGALDRISTRVIYINPDGLDTSSLPLRMQRLEKAIVASGIDALLHFGANMPYSHWDLLLARHLGIPVIFFLPQVGSFGKAKQGEILRPDEVLRQADAVVCQSIGEELRLRRTGVNALYLPLPVRMPPNLLQPKPFSRVAIHCPTEELDGNLDDILNAIREIVRKAPWISVFLICDTGRLINIKDFRKKMRSCGLEKKVLPAHQADVTSANLQNCGLFIQMGEGNGARNQLSAALAHGLPSVAYACSEAFCLGLPGVLAFARGDHARMVYYVLELLHDRERWSQLSSVAAAKFCDRSSEKFASRLDALLKKFQYCMPLSQYRPGVYEAMDASA